MDHNPYHAFSVSDQVNAVSPLAGRSQYSMSPFGGRGTGIPLVDQMMMMTLGERMYPMPQPNSKQSVHDAYWRRDRDMAMLKIRNHALANSLGARKIGGINEKSPLFSIFGSMLNNPDGMLAKQMAPFIGGNPIAAQMNAYKDLGGVNMSGFGTLRDVNGSDMADFQDTLYNKFYNWRTVDKSTLQNSQAALMKSARRRGVDSKTLSQVGGMFNSRDYTLDAGKYNTFNSEVQTMRKVADSLESGDLKTVEGKRKAKDAADTFIASLASPDAKKKISDAVAEALKEGNASAYKKALKFESIDTVARQLEIHSSLKTGDKIPTSINFKNTYGFSIEDLTSSFSTAAANRMLGNKKFGASAENFFKADNVGALDAARGLFGNGLSGKQLTTQLNQFLGVSNVDLSDTSQSKKLEDTLRGMKALARTANISIEHLMDIVEVGKSVASKTPGLHLLGGMEIANMITKAAPEMLANMSTMSSSSIRAAGGTSGFLNQSIAGKLKQASEPISRNLAGLHTFFQGNSKAQADVREFAKDGYVGGWAGYNSFLGGMSEKYGQNFQAMFAYAESNADAQAVGMRESPVFQKAGGRAGMQVMLQHLNANVGGGAAGKQALNQVSTLLSGTTVDLEAYTNNLGITGQDAKDSISMNLAKSIKQRFDASKTALANEGVTTYEGLLDAAPEVRQKYGDLTDDIGKLQYRLTERVATMVDERGRVTRKGGTDKYGAINESMLKMNKIDEQKLMTQASIIGGPMAATMQDIVSSKAYNTYREQDPRYKEYQQAIARRQAEDEAMEKETARKLGGLNSPMLTQVFNQVLGGDVDDTSEEGISRLLSPLGFGAGSQEFIRSRTAIRNISDINQALTTQELASTLTEQGGIHTSSVSTADPSLLAKNYKLNKASLTAVSKGSTQNARVANLRIQMAATGMSIEDINKVPGNHLDTLATEAASFGGEAHLAKAYDNVFTNSTKYGLTGANYAAINKEADDEHKDLKIREFLGAEKYNKLSELQKTTIRKQAQQVDQLKLGKMEGVIDLQSTKAYMSKEQADNVKKEAKAQVIATLDENVRKRMEEYASGGAGISSEDQKTAQILKGLDLTRTKDLREMQEGGTTESEVIGPDGVRVKKYALTGNLRKVAGKMNTAMDGLSFKDVETLRGKLSDLSFTEKAINRAKEAESLADKGVTGEQTLSNIEDTMKTMAAGISSIVGAINGLKEIN